jgi:putative NIF3 family GTP cyclohydrolase 1 type 2
MNKRLVILLLPFIFPGNPAIAPLYPQAGDPLSAGEVVRRIKDRITSDWQEETVDTFKGGKADMEVKGIATTFLATLEVLKKAHEAGLNMVITHEPTFYNHFDETKSLEGDSVLRAKQDFIREKKMIVFRFHDHIHQTDPDGLYKGVVDELGWSDYETGRRPYTYILPPISLKSLAANLQKTYETATIRVVGDPEMEITRAGLVLGAAGSARQIASLQSNEVEVLIIGETHEWETVEYVRDATEMGRKKALILLGHAISEEGGMNYCAQWLRGFVAEVPVKFIPAGDPFWTP